MAKKNDWNTAAMTMKIWIIGLWAAILFISFPTFVYLSSNPSHMLHFEKTQPGVAYGRGKELVRQGRYREAISVFQEGEAFFEELYNSHHFHRHLLQLLLHKRIIADTYARFDNPEDLKRALHYFREVIRLDPEFGGGHPFLRLGDVLMRMNNYEKAIEAYSNAIIQGDEPVILEAMYGRGRCFFLLRNSVLASDDWYYYLRYTTNEITRDQWLEYSQLPVSDNPRSHFILGNAWMELGDLEKASKHLEIYLQHVKRDRCAEYLLSQVNEQPLKPDMGKIPLSDCFYPHIEIPSPVHKTLFNLYVLTSGVYTLDAELSGKAIGTALPEVNVTVNKLPVENIRIGSSQPNKYHIALELRSGKNYVQFSAGSVGETEETSIFLHSLSLTKEKKSS